MSKNNNPYIIDEEEKVTPRVITEQIVRILCVIGFIFTVAMPLIICDALGSVAGNFATETGIPISAGGGDSQTKFFYGIPYMLKNSTDGFIPFKLFKTGMKWIASNSGVITDIFAGLAIAALITLYVVPVVLYVILMLSRYYEGKVMERLLTVGVKVCGVVYLVIGVILGTYAIGYLWNFSWDQDTHYAFFQQYFMAYGGIKVGVSAVIAILIAAGCLVLSLMYRKNKTELEQER